MIDEDALVRPHTSVIESASFQKRGKVSVNRFFGTKARQAIDISIVINCELTLGQKRDIVPLLVQYTLS